MIPESSIIQWREVAPWPNDAQVEQDLIISRALVEIFNHEFLKDKVAFRGGTALHKLYIHNQSRYSEDIDLVLVNRQQYGPIIDSLKELITPWLGKPNVKTKPERVTLRFKFQTELLPIQSMKLKIEINTKECFSFLGLETMRFTVRSSWFEGETKIVTFKPEEIIGTKLRALYQREKGRDLFDIDLTRNVLSLNSQSVINCFNYYIKKQGLHITRAQYENNIRNKKISKKFLNDLTPLLRQNELYKIEKGFLFLEATYIPLLPGSCP